MSIIDNLELYIPHRDPMILLDRVVSVSDSLIHTQVHIKESSFLYDDGGVPSYVGMEYIAQSIAVLANHLSAVANQSQPSADLGFLLGVRNYRVVQSRFQVGTTLDVFAELGFIEGNLGSFSGRIDCDGETLVTTTMSTFRATPEQIELMKKEVLSGTT